jgi:hypothetical protein
MTPAEERESAGLHVGGEKQTRHAEEPEELEEYAGGYIQAHQGTIQPWLLVVYAVLFVWALYYLYVYWGGLGPGLAD